LGLDSSFAATKDTATAVQLVFAAGHVLELLELKLVAIFLMLGSVSNFIVIAEFML